MANNKDIEVLKSLADQYMKIATNGSQAEKRKKWKALNSKSSKEPLVLVTYGMWNYWCRDVFSDKEMKCADEFYREYERWFKMQLFHASYNDDFIFEPWVTQHAAIEGDWNNIWGVKEGFLGSNEEGGSMQYNPVIREWGDVKKLRKPKHFVHEKETKEKHEKLCDAIGKIITVDLNYGPLCMAFLDDISYMAVRLRGLEQVMVDMYDSPGELKSFMGFIRDGILENQEQAEKKGDISLTSSANQCMCYDRELEELKPNSYGKARKDIWGFFASQEFTLISPEMHEEFLLNYQLPIAEKFGLVHYGCCEDLTKKISMLRKIKNLRIISVAPAANVQKCAEQIKTDYVISWRPNPTDMVSSEFDETKIRRILSESLKALKGTHFHVLLKDVETVRGDISRFPKWMKIVREEIEKNTR